MPLSIGNSAGIMGWPDSHADWNRPGYMLYGNSPFSEPEENALLLQPAMTFTSRLLSIRQVNAGSSIGYGGTWTAARQSTIGTVSVGYAGGYPRSAANGTPILVNGKIVPLVGTVSMDMITIDLTDHANAAIGDTVVLWGDGLSVNEVAKHSNTIGYDLLTRQSRGVETEYVNVT
jgi:alanine racemase